jgi:hypothetical protein
MDGKFDRSVEDLGNIVALEHVNVTVPDQQVATLFYVAGLGLTRDPYLMTSVNNMWVNIGRSQFHLPTNKPQVVRGANGSTAPASISPSMICMSRRDARGAIASAATSPTHISVR